MKIKIQKASGVIEDFNSDKLLSSLIRSGAAREQAEEIIWKIIPDIQPYTSTKNIYRLAHKYLRQFNRSSVLRYSLKKALFGFGPTGYPFERYMGELLKNYDYKVKVGVIMEGKCVRHEVDVFAENNSEIALMECKYHSNAGKTPDVKVAMYVDSRFRDLRVVLKNQYPGKAFTGWLVTNTRFTADAIQYATCTGLKLKSWGYPEDESLEQMIEDKKLYPVTVMSGLPQAQMRKLIEQKIILMKDLARMDTRALQRLLSITEKKARAFKEQAEKLCFC